MNASTTQTPGAGRPELAKGEHHAPEVQPVGERGVSARGWRPLDVHVATCPFCKTSFSKLRFRLHPSFRVVPTAKNDPEAILVEQIDCNCRRYGKATISIEHVAPTTDERSAYEDQGNLALLGAIEWTLTADHLWSKRVPSLQMASSAFGIAARYFRWADREDLVAMCIELRDLARIEAYGFTIRDTLV